MSTSPYRRMFVEELAASVADLVDGASEPPFQITEVQVSRAADLVYVRGALARGIRDRRPVLAWLLRRYLRTLEPGGAATARVWERCSQCRREYLYPHLCREHLLCGRCHPSVESLEPGPST